MFCQLPAEDETHTIKTVTPKKKHKRKSRKNKAKKETKKKDFKFAKSMSAWAENFATAATWQLKHQVAYWKARAKALEYENTVLHDVIRRNNCVIRSRTNTESEGKMETGRNRDSESEESEESEEIEENQGEDFEVSEEFIQFLTANAKFKEDAKRERERLKEQSFQENQVTIEPRETAEENRGRMKELYGDKWQMISALEISLLTSFLQESDDSKPVYWPNVPFNFNY